MKKLFIFILLSLWMFYGPLAGQQIIRMEYFTDADPGFGNGISVPVETLSDQTVSFTALLDGLDPGLHFLYLRAQDDNGHWSQTLQRMVLVRRLPEGSHADLTRVEFFWDNDPGFGEATSVDLPAEPLGAVSMILPMDTLSPGFHRLFVRPLDENGCWGNTYSQPFFSMFLSFYENADIAYAEYFFDEDPGQGQGTALQLPDGSDIEMSLNIPLDDLLPGFHQLFVRARDVNGFWSCVYKHIFWLEKTSDAPGITQMEYFFDTDPGIGHATKISGDLLPGTVFAVDLPLDTLSRGFHTIYVRTRDETGSWGLTHFQPFISIHAPADSIRIVRMEYFVDEDPGFGNGFPVSLIYPGADVRKHFVAELNDLEAGNHLFFLRAIDDQGVWSMVYTEEFEFVMTDPCDPPADLEATDIEETTAMAHWVSDDAPWDLLYGALDFEATELGVLVHALDANQHLMENLLPGSFSEFYVRSTCSDGQVSPWAGPAQFHTLPLPTYQLTLAVDPAEGGTVTGEGNYTQGETVNITATPNENYLFLHWSGSTTYVDNPDAASAMVTMPGEAVSLTAHFQLVTGLEHLAENGFSVFPNPAAEKLYLQFYKPDSKKVLLVISNLQGQVVEEMELSEKGYVQLTLDVSHLETGVYMLHIRGEHQFPVKKIIVAR